MRSRAITFVFLGVRISHMFFYVFAFIIHTYRIALDKYSQYNSLVVHSSARTLLQPLDVRSGRNILRLGDSGPRNILSVKYPDLKCWL